MSTNLENLSSAKSPLGDLGVKAVLFDMDGILYDSMPEHVQAWHETMSAIGIPTPKEEYYPHEGRTGRATIQIFFNKYFGREATDEEVISLYAQKTQRFVELSTQVRLMPGALEVLQIVKEMGLQRIVVTGSGQRTLFDELDTHFPGYFDKNLLVTAHDVQYCKPHPEPYLTGLRKGNLLPKEAIVIENAPLGIESARAAGIFTVGVNTGPMPEKALWDAGANVVYPSMRALRDYFFCS
jgi:HAD superfamily hydrolase (TIGR01509 family)